MRALLHANRALEAGQEVESLRWLAMAESLQVDTTAFEFRRAISGKRAYARADSTSRKGQLEAARSELLRVLATHPGDVPSRRMLADVEQRLAERSARR